MSIRDFKVYVLTILVSFGVISCKGTGNYQGRELSLSFVKIEIGPDQLTDYRIFDNSTSSGSTLLVGYNPQASSLDIFDITNRRLLNVKPIGSSGPDAVSDVLSFSMRNDSIVWFACMNRFLIYDVDRGKTVRAHSLEDLNDRFSLARYSYFFDNRGKLVALNDSTVLLSVAYFPLYDGNSELKLAALNVKTGQVNDLAPAIPDWVSGDHHFGGLNTMHYYHHDGNIVYNFPFMDSVFTWSSEENSIKRARYASEKIPGVVEPYRGDGGMESIIHASSESDYYTGIQPILGTNKQYRFVVSTSVGEETAYTTYLEVFEASELRFTHKITPMIKTRGFTVKDSIFLFTESGSEDYLEFAVFSGL